MIKNEDAWLRALQERNNVTHSYNEKIALGIVRQAKAIFMIYLFSLRMRLIKIGCEKMKLGIDRKKEA